MEVFWNHLHKSQIHSEQTQEMKDTKRQMVPAVLQLRVLEAPLHSRIRETGNRILSLCKNIVHGNCHFPSMTDFCVDLQNSFLLPVGGMKDFQSLYRSPIRAKVTFQPAVLCHISLCEMCLCVNYPQSALQAPSQSENNTHSWCNQALNIQNMKKAGELL